MTTEPTSLRPHLTVEIGPSIYDRVSAAIVAGILLFGFMLLVLFSIWLKPAVDQPITIRPDFPKPGETLTLEKVESKDFLEPGVQEFPEIAVSQLAQMLPAISAAVSTVQGSPELKVVSKSKTGPGKPQRRPSPIPSSPNWTPIHERWSIQFQADDIDDYARQLSFFNIDVAAIHQSKNSIWRINDVAGANQVVVTSRQQENQTLRFQHKKSQMRRWDRELCERAGVEVTDTIQSHFYPVSTQRELEKIESIAVAQAKRQLKDVRKTTFKAIEKGNGFSFEVAEILYH